MTRAEQGTADCAEAALLPQLRHAGARGAAVPVAEELLQRPVSAEAFLGFTHEAKPQTAPCGRALVWSVVFPGHF